MESPNENMKSKQTGHYISGYRESIPKEELANLQSEQYTGRIFLIASEREAKKASNYLLDIGVNDVLGFDTETRPSFLKNDPHVVSLVQISTETECFLFRTINPVIWNYLKPILEDERILKIGLSLKDDFRAIRHAGEENDTIITIRPQNFIELQTYVKQFGIKDCGLSRIYANLFNKKISKKMRLSNWEASPLTEEQKHYAALDAYATRRIYIELERVKANANP